MKGSTPHTGHWGWWPSLLTVLSILISKWSQPALCYHMSCSDWLRFICASVWAVSLKGSRSSGQNQKKVGYSPCWFSSAKPTQPGVKVRPQECNLQRLAPQSAFPWASPLCSCPHQESMGQGANGSGCQVQTGLQSESESELEFSSSVLRAVVSFPESPCLRNLATSLKIR